MHSYNTVETEDHSENSLVTYLMGPDALKRTIPSIKAKIQMRTMMKTPVPTPRTVLAIGVRGGWLVGWFDSWPCDAGEL